MVCSLPGVASAEAASAQIMELLEADFRSWVVAPLGTSPTIWSTQTIRCNLCLKRLKTVLLRRTVKPVERALVRTRFRRARSVERAVVAQEPQPMEHPLRRMRG